MGKQSDGTPGKKAPAQSGTRRPPGPATAGSVATTMSPDNIKRGIARQLYIALERLGADQELLGIINIWSDTLDDPEVLSMLLYIALERLGADQELLGIIDIWSDTLNDAEVLSMLRVYNTTARMLREPQ